jgi:hypothetical protein
VGVAFVHRVTAGIRGCIRPVVRQPTELQHIRNQIEMISYGVTLSAPAAPMVMFRML